MDNSPPTLRIGKGTTFRFETSWVTDDPGNPTVKLDGCSALFAIADGKGNRRVECSTENGLIHIIPKPDGESDAIEITIVPALTETQGAAEWKGAHYELKVTFLSGDVYSILRGPAVLLEGAA
ncbi:hypothetical protein [Grimontia hollisae]|uniref:hypothetical protein n=1 Tax=Grimontia hollisae TaxID=673 RepID=UPI001303D84E|nr:hypothetical protein [Grimontia hollisae]